jgi:predicted nucleotidyltransferase
MSDAKSRAVGIIAEYNPFHNGHLYHLKRTAALSGADVSAAVMSGDFVQRGEPALFDKWDRAAAAVRNGVDLVAELPFVYACNSAEYFASGAVRLLETMGCIDCLSFGSEVGETAPLKAVAGLLTAETEAFREALRAALKQGLSFPAARFEAVRELAGEAAAGLLNMPNNILAIEYIKQLMRAGSRIEPITVPRGGAGYFGAAPQEKIAGAAAIRECFLAGNAAEAARYMPPGGLPPGGFSRFDDYFALIACAARVKSGEELRTVLSASEGLENRLKRALDRARGMDSLIDGVKSKRYTRTRVRRFLLHVLFGLSREKFRALDAAGPAYARVLALNGNGGKLLRRIRKAGGIQVITNLSKQRPESPEATAMLELDILAADIYNLVRDGDFYEGSDFRRRPYISSSFD